MNDLPNLYYDVEDAINNRLENQEETVLDLLAEGDEALTDSLFDYTDIGQALDDESVPPTNPRWQALHAAVILWRQRL